MDRKSESGAKASSLRAPFIKPTRVLDCDEDETASQAKLAVSARRKPKEEAEALHHTATGRKDG